jgi:hypothetical protein
MNEELIERTKLASVNFHYAHHRIRPSSVVTSARKYSLRLSNLGSGASAGVERRKNTIPATACRNVRQGKCLVPRNAGFEQGCHELMAIVHAELVVDEAHEVLHRAVRNPQLLRDGFTGLGVRNRQRDALLRR